ncbi:MAG: metalloregulator ArsR/SmtB family transcription factor [Nanoarchaeota archaeon]
MDKDVTLFKVLADTTRLKIIRLLLDGEKCVCEIFPLVKRTQSTVSIQLGKLEKSGVLASRRQGKWIYYRIKDERILTLLNVVGGVKR